MDTYLCKVKLNITNGFGNTVLQAILQANIPGMIDEALKPHGSVIKTEEIWDSGVLTHDLYLKYTMSIHSYRLVKANSYKIAAKLLKYTGYLKGTICSNVQTAVYNGFQEKLNGPLQHLAVVLRSCSVV